MPEATTGLRQGPRRHAYPRSLKIGTLRAPRTRRGQSFPALRGRVTALRGRAKPLRRKTKQWPRGGRAIPAAAGPRNASIEKNWSRQKIQQGPAATKSSPPRGRPFFPPRTKTSAAHKICAALADRNCVLTPGAKSRPANGLGFEPAESPVPWNSLLPQAMPPTSPLLQGWPVSADTRMATQNHNSA